MVEKKPLALGQKFGKLTVIASAEPVLRGGKNRPAYLMRCECGREKVMMKQSLRSGTSSCDCAKGNAKPGSGAPAWRCTVRGCVEPKFKFKYCLMHYRFSNMKSRACASRKYSPAMKELEKLVPLGMICPSCDRSMVWSTGTVTSNLITLQHDRNGTVRLICMACNSRHSRFEGDEFYDLPKDSKRCHLCKVVKPLEEFLKVKTGWMGRGVRCLPCHNADCKRRKAIKKASMPVKIIPWRDRGAALRKLTPELIERIKARYALGDISYFLLGMEFGLAPRTVWRAVNVPKPVGPRHLDGSV